MHYDTLFAEIEQAAREEYEAQFGPEYRARHPFKLDGAQAHAQVMARIRQEQA